VDGPFQQPRNVSTSSEWKDKGWKPILGQETAAQRNDRMVVSRFAGHLIAVSNGILECEFLTELLVKGMDDASRGTWVNPSLPSRTHRTHNAPILGYSPKRVTDPDTLSDFSFT
jgi:hypothetical protein